MNPFEGYRLTSPFGPRMHPVYKVPKFHRGVDLVVSPVNGPLYAFVPGEVIHACEGRTGTGFGNMGFVAAIKDKYGFVHCYAHMSMIVVKVGQHVDRGQMIGRQGSTGVSTGPHLHYEIRKKCSPSYGWTETESGVVEPTQYLIDYFAKEAQKGDNKVDKVDANKLIDTYLKPAWGAAKAKGDNAGMTEANRLANELRKASGQPLQ